MTEFEIREDCKNCGGDGGYIVPGPTSNGKYVMTRDGHFVATCFKCDGSGKQSWDDVDTYKLV